MYHVHFTVIHTNSRHILSPKTIGILTKVFCASGQKFGDPGLNGSKVITWTSSGLTQTHAQTHKQTDAGVHNTWRPKLTSGRNHNSKSTYQQPLRVQLCTTWLEFPQSAESVSMQRTIPRVAQSPSLKQNKTKLYYKHYTNFNVEAFSPWCSEQSHSLWSLLKPWKQNVLISSNFINQTISWTHLEYVIKFHMS